MKVFISWSQTAGRQMALVLREWLPEVIQQIDPWVSVEDISKGKRWSAEIASQLDVTGQGLVCVTRSNMHEPWLNFEAGALAKSLESAQVRPVLLDLQPHEVTGPMAEFQATVSSDPEDFYRLVESLNAVCEPQLVPDRLRRAFDRAWPDLVKRLNEVRTVAEGATGSKGVTIGTPERGMEDMLSEVLDRIRGIERSMAAPVSEPVRRTSLSRSDEDDLLAYIDSSLGENRPTLVTFGEHNEVLLFFKDGPPREVGKAVLSMYPGLRKRGIGEVITSEPSGVVHRYHLGHMTPRDRALR
jgi:hypothetical protein